MAIPLSVGKYQPVRNTYGAQAGGGGGFQPMSWMGGGKPPGAPGPQYGGQFMYPNMGTSGNRPAADQQGPQAAPIPTITLPTGTAGTPAYTPDYASMIGGSWEVDAAESAMASQMAAARAAFQKQLRASFIDLGYQGDLKEGGLGDFSKYIDKDTIQKAIDNKYSAYAQVQKQKEQNQAMMEAQMAARGGTTSGTMTAGETDLSSQVEQAKYEGLRNFLSGGEAGLSNLTMMKNQLAAGVAQARAAAASRLAAMYPPTPAVPATEPNWGDFWGSYQGGTWALPGTGGYIVPSGIPGAGGSPQPWYVGPGSGVPGDLSWLNPKAR